MATCANESCGKRARLLDEDGFCPECHTLAEEIRARLSRHELRKPDLSGAIRGRVATVPAPNADASCSACGHPFARIEDQEQELADDAGPLYLHNLCHEILMKI